MPMHVIDLCCSLHTTYTGNITERIRVYNTHTHTHREREREKRHAVTHTDIEGIKEQVKDFSEKVREKRDRTREARSTEQEKARHWKRKKWKPCFDIMEQVKYYHPHKVSHQTHNGILWAQAHCIVDASDKIINNFDIRCCFCDNILLRISLSSVRIE